MSGGYLARCAYLVESGKNKHEIAEELEIKPSSVMTYISALGMLKEYHKKFPCLKRGTLKKGLMPPTLKKYSNLEELADAGFSLFELGGYYKVSPQNMLGILRRSGLYSIWKVARKDHNDKVETEKKMKALETIANLVYGVALKKAKEYGTMHSAAMEFMIYVDPKTKIPFDKIVKILN